MTTQLDSPSGAGHQTSVALEISGLFKTFPGVQALRGVSLSVASGSVHALLGHNGCGKSTLVKVLSGAHSPDPGSQGLIYGQPLELGDAEHAKNLGLRFVHQELGIVSEFDAMDNIGLVLGYKRGPLGKIDWRAQAKATSALLGRFGIALDVRRPLSEASPQERTAVAIVRAVAGLEPGRGVLVLDEPTAALPAKEVDELFRLIREVRDSGTAVVLVSHRLDEVMAVADHATVLRSGEVIWDGSLDGVTTHDLVHLISGTDAADSAATPSKRSEQIPLSGSTCLEARALEARYLRGVDVTIREGEILGVAGLLGSGREELPYVLAGAVKGNVSGEIFVGGIQIEDPTIRRMQRAGVAFVPADRASESVIGEFTTGENVTLASLRGIARGGIFGSDADRNLAKKWLRSLHADPAVHSRPISTLSGGNQQKAILARWLSTKPKVLLLAEPTAGIDVGARATIYAELRERAATGLAVLVSSSDIEDLFAVCDRVIVLRDGLVAAEVDHSDLDRKALVGVMEGAHSEQ